MNWAAHKHTWPNAEFSQFLETRAQRWHVQIAGDGPDLVLLHGAGSSCHSWRNILPALAKEFRVIALDLPGQGFTTARTKTRFTLDLMSEDIAGLLDQIGSRPFGIVGHSAGVAIALRLALDWDGASQAKIIGLNGALGNFEGLAGVVFPVMAKLLALNPLTAPVFSRTASSTARVRKLVASTGSELNDSDIALLRELIADDVHVAGTLSMMANWSLDRLIEELPRITQEVILIAGLADRAVPPKTSQQAAKRLPKAKYVEIPGLGHLMQEEDPGLIRDLIAQHLGN